MDLFLFLCFKDKQEIMCHDYVMTDLEGDLPHVLLEINFLIQDPKAEYFVVASGDMKHYLHTNRYILMQIKTLFSRIWKLEQ
jgi:hypothetical protein